MRERIAKGFAVGLTLLVTVLAGAFAARKNAPGAPDAPRATTDAATPFVPVPPPTEPPTAEVLERGRVVFDEQGCTRCHRLEGTGNPRSPLDGVGARLAPDRIRAFIVADDAVRGELTSSVARAKVAFADLPEADLDALVTYLATLR
ncbi:MAG: cytochrome c [Gemmatimonadota bacterium]